MQAEIMRLASCSALAAASVLLALSGCAPDISPDQYATAATQKANKVDQGVIVGVRQVTVTPDGNTGAVAGAAAGGVIGAQTPGSDTASALGAVGGGVLGGLLGSSVEKATGDTLAWEYIVRKPNDDLVSVTQADKVPLAIGQHVLVINGIQARVVPDYTVPLPEPKKDKPADKPKDAAPDKPADTSAAAPSAASAVPPLVLPPVTEEPLANPEKDKTKTLPPENFPPSVPDAVSPSTTAPATPPATSSATGN
jgi:outer membrane lipoprotein SlyB